MTPAAGRLIARADDAASAVPVAVLSHRYWQRRFDGRADAIGRTILINRVPTTIIGVSAAGFDGTARVGETVDVSVPLAHYLVFQPDRASRAKPGYWWLSVMARLAPGATADQARAALDQQAFQAARDGWVSPDHALADGPDDVRLLVDPGAQGHNEIRRAQRIPLLLLLALGGLVLIAACVNVSTLLVARADARRRDFALRLAIGASRRGIVWQCIVEALLLSGAAAVAGTAVAWLSRDALRALHPFGRNPTGVLDLPLDTRILAATAGVSVACALAFALLPALQASRIDLATAFQGGTPDTRQPAPLVGRARPARGAGGVVAGAAGQCRPVLADAQPARCRRRRLRSARSAAVPRRRDLGRLCDGYEVKRARLRRQGPPETYHDGQPTGALPGRLVRGQQTVPTRSETTR